MLLADCYLHLKRPREAQSILETADMAQQLEAGYKELVSRLELMLEAADTPAIIELQQQMQQQPDNLELRYELAIQYSQADRIEEALENILFVLQRDRNYSDGGARKTMLDILNAMPKGDPLAVKYQRKLFTLLY